MKRSHNHVEATAMDCIHVQALMHSSAALTPAQRLAKLGHASADVKGSLMNARQSSNDESSADMPRIPVEAFSKQTTLMTSSHSSKAHAQLEICCRHAPDPHGSVQEEERAADQGAVSAFYQPAQRHAQWRSLPGKGLKQPEARCHLRNI